MKLRNRRGEACLRRVLRQREAYRGGGWRQWWLRLKPVALGVFGVMQLGALAAILVIPIFGWLLEGMPRVVGVGILAAVSGALICYRAGMWWLNGIDLESEVARSWQLLPLAREEVARRCVRSGWLAPVMLAVFTWLATLTLPDGLGGDGAMGASLAALPLTWLAVTLWAGPFGLRRTSPVTERLWMQLPWFRIGHGFLVAAAVIRLGHNVEGVRDFAAVLPWLPVAWGVLPVAVEVRNPDVLLLGSAVVAVAGWGWARMQRRGVVSETVGELVADSDNSAEWEQELVREGVDLEAYGRELNEIMGGEESEREAVVSGLLAASEPAVARLPVKRLVLAAAAVPMAISGVGAIAACWLGAVTIWALPLVGGERREFDLMLTGKGPAPLLLGLPLDARGLSRKIALRSVREAILPGLVLLGLWLVLGWRGGFLEVVIRWSGWLLAGWVALLPAIITARAMTGVRSERFCDWPLVLNSASLFLYLGGLIGSVVALGTAVRLANWMVYATLAGWWLASLGLSRLSWWWYENAKVEVGNQR